jgi:diguanylate cyclase (GGDEF)-like protein
MKIDIAKQKNKLVVLAGVSLFLGCLMLRMLVVRHISFDWLISEIFFVNNIFYFFIAVVFPLILLFFANRIITLEGQLEAQIEEFEQTRKIMDVGKDVLESKNKELSTEATIDPLTQLNNRKFILNRINREIQTVLQSKSIDATLFAMMIDVDNFKFINDQYGHAAGDLVLKDISNILKRSIRGMDFVGRLGGDEFVIVTPDTNPKAVRLIANRIRQNVNSHPFVFGEENLDVHLSIGVSSFDSLGDSTSETFLQKVDECLLEAKRAGKDQIVIK